MGTKISDLNALATADDADALAIVDDSATETKKITAANLRTSLGNGAVSTVMNSDLTASRALSSNGSGKIAVANTTLSQLNALNGLTASRALRVSAGGLVEPATVTATEQGYLSGVTSAIQTQLNNRPTGPYVNLLRNPNFELWDLGTTFNGGTTPANSDNTVLLPHWILLSDGNDRVDVTRESTSPPDGSRYFWRGTMQAANRFALLQVLRAEDAIPLRNKSVSLRIAIKVSNATPRPLLYILAWDGSADAWTDPIGAWGATPTFAANWTSEGSLGSLGVSAGTWVFSNVLENISLDTAGLNNIGILLYCADTAYSIGNTIDLAQFQLQIGAKSTEFVPRPVNLERQLSARNNYEATAAPGTGDDIIDGYALNSQWIDVSADDHYVCLDPIQGAAVWKKTTP